MQYGSKKRLLLVFAVVSGMPMCIVAIKDQEDVLPLLLPYGRQGTVLYQRCLYLQSVDGGNFLLGTAMHQLLQEKICTGSTLVVMYNFLQVVIGILHTPQFCHKL